jgi:hydrogenase maturation factor
VPRPARDATPLPPHCAAGDQHCITCADEGTPMRVTALDRDDGLAYCVDADGAGSEVETALVGAVGVGDRLLVHAGTAIARVEAEAFA